MRVTKNHDPELLGDEQVPNHVQTSPFPGLPVCNTVQTRCKLALLLRNRIIIDRNAQHLDPGPHEAQQVHNPVQSSPFSGLVVSNEVQTGCKLALLLHNRINIDRNEYHLDPALHEAQQVPYHARNFVVNKPDRCKWGAMLRKIAEIAL